MTKFKLFSYLFLFLFSSSIFGQELDWLKKSNSNNFFGTYRFYASTQSDNDFYLAGDFWKDLIIDNFNIEIPLDTGNGFIVKIDESGAASALWHFESNQYVRINSMAMHPVTGSLIATGSFQENLIFDNETWDAPFYSQGFVMSINPDGSLDWMKELEPQNNYSFIIGQAVTIDNDGNIFAGFAAGGTVNIDNLSFEFEQETNGTIIAKFNANGELLKTDMWESLDFEGAIDVMDMVVDSDNQLIIGGCTSQTVEIADSIFTFSPASNQPLLIKMEGDLNLKWLKTYETTRSHVRDIHVNGNDLILSLQYNNSIDVDGDILTGSGSWGDMLILALDEDAEVEWLKNFVLSENGGIRGVYCNSIVEWNEQYYLGGMYQGDVVLDGSLVLDNDPSGSPYQFPFIMSLSKEGELNSVYDFVGSNPPGMISEVSANNSHLVFAGDFSGQITIEDTSVSADNSKLFYGALAIDVSAIEILENTNDLFSIYPTLASDFVIIKTTSEVKNISLISSVGMRLKQFSGTNRVIDVSDLTAGVYYLAAEIDSEVVYVKFVRQ